MMMTATMMMMTIVKMCNKYDDDNDDGDDGDDDDDDDNDNDDDGDDGDDDEEDPPLLTPYSQATTARLASGAREFKLTPLF